MKLVTNTYAVMVVEKYVIVAHAQCTRMSMSISFTRMQTVRMQTEEDEAEDSREISESQMHELRVALFELKSDLDREVHLERSLQTPPWLLHGMDAATISNILEVGIQLYSTACLIVEVFASVFADVADHQDLLFFLS